MKLLFMWLNKSVRFIFKKYDIQVIFVDYYAIFPLILADLLVPGSRSTSLLRGMVLLLVLIHWSLISGLKVTEIAGNRPVLVVGALVLSHISFHFNKTWTFHLQFLNFTKTRKSLIFFFRKKSSNLTKKAFIFACIFLVLDVPLITQKGESKSIIWFHKAFTNR